MKKYYDEILKNLVCGIYAVMIIAGCLQVFFRYVLNYSLSWTEELGRYSFVWLTFVGAALCVLNETNIGLDLIVKRLGSSAQYRLQLFIDVSTLAFLAFLIYQGSLITLKTTGQVSAAMDLPMSIFYLSIPLGGTFMWINMLRIFIKHRSEPKDSI